jgi:hypothetical protein
VQKAILLLLVPLLAGASCAPVGKFATVDLTNAARVATWVSDPQGMACWAALTPVAQAVETAPGLASVIEADRILAFATQGPNAPCNAVGGTILAMFLRKALPPLP